VRDASQAAGRIAAGDLSARLPVDSRDEFGAWAATFNRMAASLERTVGELQLAQDQQRTFVADVSHELRTPLTALVQEAALLRDHLDALPPDGRRGGELLVRDVARLRTLVDDLMEISRFDAAAEVAALTEFDAAAFVRAVVAARLPSARLDVPDEPLRVVLDRRRLERILGNLLDNAREHGEAAAVEVGLGEEGDTIRLTVADRGPGVPPEELPYLFERFHKADPSRSRGGSGLGLAIAREHAELLGGTLDATLGDGGGLRFELRLPVTRPLPGGDDPVTEEIEA
jgi:signal transduction histidine kinase